MRFGIVKRWPVWAACVLWAAGSAQAAPWRRAEFLGSSVGVNVFRPDLRSTDAGSPENLAIWDGRAVVRAPGLDPADAAAFAAELDARLRAAFDPGDWKVPFTAAEPLRVLAASAPGLDFSDVFSLAGDRDGVVALNLAGHSFADAAAEAVRGAAVFVLRGLAPATPSGVVSAAARALSLGADLSESDREELRENGAAPEHSLDAPGSELFAAEWIREMAAAAGPGFLRNVWTGRVARGESSLSAFGTAFRELGGSPGDAFYRSLARLYGAEEVFGDSAKLTESDLAAGALNAAAPGARAWRFFAASPAGSGGWSVAWPDDGARAFAVVHYEDGLPSDVIPVSAGERKVLPASGVTRIDWVVLGGEHGPAPLAAPAAVVHEAEFPVAGLSAEARTAEGEGVALSWTTASHRDLSGWAILRSEVTEDGRIVRAEPESLPAQAEARDGASYDFVDTSAVAGHYYRYDVWAVTADGVLSRAFRATLRAR